MTEILRIKKQLIQWIYKFIFYVVSFFVAKKKEAKLSRLPDRQLNMEDTLYIHTFYHVQRATFLTRVQAVN